MRGGKVHNFARGDIGNRGAPLEVGVLIRSAPLCQSQERTRLRLDLCARVEEGRLHTAHSRHHITSPRVPAPTLTPPTLSALPPVPTRPTRLVDCRPPRHDCQLPHLAQLPRPGVCTAARTAPFKSAARTTRGLCLTTRWRIATPRQQRVARAPDFARAALERLISGRA